jgi:hypothetical protein
MVLVATLICPFCGHKAVETMPTTYCQRFYDCPGCKGVMKTKPGECCVFCSYSDNLCPPKVNGDCCQAINEA